MFHSQLRRAIAKAFPSRYNWLTWPRLLSDFVDLGIKSYLTLRDQYHQERQLNPNAVRPMVPPELRQAVRLLAKQQGHSYEFLALTHYLLQWEVAALSKENVHWQKQATGYEQLANDYQRLASEVTANDKPGMTTLQASIAQFFPDAYTPATWKDLLPQFIALHIERYDQLVKAYQQALAIWQQSDQSTPEPAYPIYPIEFGEACEEQAKQEGLDFHALACCLYIGHDQVDFHRQQSQQYAQLCQEYDEASMQVRKEYIALRKGTTLGKWLN
ncbi:hypothetical protein [Spirosoma migulaei]